MNRNNSISHVLKLKHWLFGVAASVLLVLAPQVRASEDKPIQATPSCTQLNSVRDVLDCALKNHPEIKKAEAALRQGDELESQASQIPNPELDSKATYGKLTEFKKVTHPVSKK